MRFLWIVLLFSLPLTADANVQSKTLYRLKIGDRLLISIYGEGNTEREVVIDSAGELTYPIVGTIAAARKTIDELRADMNEKISKFYRYAFVTITPLQFGGQTYTILGQVLDPGSKTIFGKETLLSAIARARGFPVGQYRANDIDLADLDHSFLLRHGKHLDVDFAQLVYEGDLSQNITLQGGDYIFIPSALSRQIYVLGEVGMPGGYGSLTAVTLVEAIAQAGGLLPNASSRMIVLRGSLCDPYTFNIDINRIMKGCCSDFRLQPGDIVYAPPRRFSYFRNLVRQAVTVFVATFASQAGTVAFEKLFNTTSDFQNVNVIPGAFVAPAAAAPVVGP